jgi:hypothetical protein
MTQTNHEERHRHTRRRNPVPLTWTRNGTHCSIERVQTGWLARRNGLPVAVGETAEVATTFAIGEVPTVWTDKGYGHPDWSVPGVADAVRALADEREPVQGRMLERWL